MIIVIKQILHQQKKIVGENLQDEYAADSQIERKENPAKIQLQS